MSDTRRHGCISLHLAHKLAALWLCGFTHARLLLHGASGRVGVCCCLLVMLRRS